MSDHQRGDETSLYMQSEAVANEVEEFDAFWRCVNRRAALRTLLLWHPLVLAWIWFRHDLWNRLRGRPADAALARRRELELDCTAAEGQSEHFRIVQSDPMNVTHALSDRVIEKFPDFKWLALEDVIRMRIDQLPNITIRGPLEYLVLLMSAAPALIFLHRLVEGGLPALGMNADWAAGGPGAWITGEWRDLAAGALIALAYFLAAFLALRAMAFGARRRLRRAAEILRYTAIRAREGDLPVAGQESDGQG